MRSWVWSATPCKTGLNGSDSFGYWAAPGDLRKWQCRGSDCSSKTSNSVTLPGFADPFTVPSQQTKGHVITRICRDSEGRHVPYAEVVHSGGDSNTTGYTCEPARSYNPTLL